MATKKRPGSARRILAKQEAARKQPAPGKRFVGETAGESTKARRAQRAKVARTARSAAAREARPVAAARSVAAKRPSRKAKAPAAPRSPPELQVVQQEPEPAAPSFTSGVSEETRGAGAEAAARAVAFEPAEPLSVDVSDEYRDAAPPLGAALADLLRSALRLARTLVTTPLRLAIALRRQRSAPALA